MVKYFLLLVFIGCINIGFAQPEYVKEKKRAHEAWKKEKEVQKKQREELKKNNKYRKRNEKAVKNIQTLTPTNDTAIDVLSDERQELVLLADNYIGTPYKYGGNGPSSFDCSGFTKFIYKNALDEQLPRSSHQQFKSGAKLSVGKIGIGDLVFFRINKRSVGHVGIVYNVLDNGEVEMIHVSSSKGVQIININKSNYWSRRLIGYRSFLI